MQKYGVVDESTMTCALCNQPATTYVRGEPRCDAHVSTDDARTKSVKVAEERGGPRNEQSE